MSSTTLTLEATRRCLVMKRAAALTGTMGLRYDSDVRRIYLGV